MQMQKLLTFFFSKTISIYAIFNDQSFNDTLTNDIVSFEQLSPDCCVFSRSYLHCDRLFGEKELVHLPFLSCVLHHENMLL